MYNLRCSLICVTCVLSANGMTASNSAKRREVDLDCSITFQLDISIPSGLRQRRAAASLRDEQR